MRPLLNEWKWLWTSQSIFLCILHVLEPSWRLNKGSHQQRASLLALTLFPKTLLKHQEQRGQCSPRHLWGVFVLGLLSKLASEAWLITWLPEGGLGWFLPFLAFIPSIHLTNIFWACTRYWEHSRDWDRDFQLDWLLNAHHQRCDWSKELGHTSIWKNRIPKEGACSVSSGTRDQCARK